MQAFRLHVLSTGMDLDLPSPEPFKPILPLAPIPSHFPSIVARPGQQVELVRTHRGGFIGPGTNQLNPAQSTVTGYSLQPNLPALAHGLTTPAEAEFAALLERPSKRSPADLMHQMRGRLDKAVDVVQGLLLKPENRFDDKVWSDFYYSSSARSAYERKAEAYFKEHPEARPRFETAHQNALLKWDALAVAKAHEKTIKEGRKLTAETKKREVSDLGISLPKLATRETYLLLRESLKPVEGALAAGYHQQLTSVMTAVLDALKANRMDFEKTYPVMSMQDRRWATGLDREKDLRIQDTRRAARDWVLVENGVAAPKSDNEMRIKRDSKDMAAHEITAFSGKLTEKIDTARKEEGQIDTPVKSVTYQGNPNPHEWSTLTATMTDGKKQVWETKIIVNYSVYQKAFNQWPTRRADAPKS